MSTQRRHTVEFTGGSITFIERRSTGRGYASNRELLAAPRMYVSIEDETLMSNLENRKRRPYNVYKSMIHSSGLAGVLDISKLSWSQHAGCSCPCSPGFILKSQLVTFDDSSSMYYWDAWVKLHDASHVDDSKPARVLASATL